MRPARTAPSVPFVMSHCAEARTHAPAVIVARPSVASFCTPSTSSRGQVNPDNPSKFDQDQLSAPLELQFVMPDPLLWASRISCSRPVSPHRHSILILINAADDSAPSIRQTIPVHVHGGQRCAHSTSFDRYSPKGSLARHGRGDLVSPVETASAGSDVVCHPTTTVSAELNRSLAAQRR